MITHSIFNLKDNSKKRIYHSFLIANDSVVIVSNLVSVDEKVRKPAVR